MSEHNEQHIERARALRADIDQYFRDADYWNRQHPDEEPIDPDPDGALTEQTAKLNEIINAAEREKAAA